MTATINTSEIENIHSVQDQAKVDSIAASMTDSGWVGRPLVVIDGTESGECMLALTGVHRIAAAKAAGLDEVPVVLVDLEGLEEAGYTFGAYDGYYCIEDCDGYRPSDDEGIARVLIAAGYDLAANLVSQESNFDGGR